MTCLAMISVTLATPLVATRFPLSSFRLVISGFLKIQDRTLSLVARITLNGAPPFMTLTTAMVPAMLN